MWLQNSGLITEENEIYFCIIIPQPKSGNVNLEVEQEPVFKCSIKTPVAREQFVFINSDFQCRVGDIIILEKGEGLWINANIEPRGICLLGTLYEIE